MTDNKKILGVIPARFASSRFPGKPLADIVGKSMIQRVYEQAVKARFPDQIVVATDDSGIYNHVISFGGNAVITSPSHRSGTERCAEVASSEQYSGFEIIINIQGDEPLIDPDQIDILAGLFLDQNTKIATLVRPVTDQADLPNPNIIKVVLAKSNHALYFSRLPIPYIRTGSDAQTSNHFTFYHHIGIYGFRRNTLLEIARLEPTPCETAESLEQLRWLENGYQILAGISSHLSYSIDTMEDLHKISELILRNEQAGTNQRIK